MFTGRHTVVLREQIGYTLCCISDFVYIIKQGGTPRETMNRTETQDEAMVSYVTVLNELTGHLYGGGIVVHQNLYSRIKPRRKRKIFDVIQRKNFAYDVRERIPTLQNRHPSKTFAKLRGLVILLGYVRPSMRSGKRQSTAV